MIQPLHEFIIAERQRELDNLNLQHVLATRANPPPRDRTKNYVVGPGKRLVNLAFMARAKRGAGPRSLHVLEVTGRRSGKTRKVPLHVVEAEGRRWIVAIYGLQSWVLNVRAACSGTLERDGHREVVGLIETDSTAATNVLRTYLPQMPHVRPYLGADHRSSDVTLAALAATHPVFEVVALQQCEVIYNDGLKSHSGTSSGGMKGETRVEELHASCS